MREFLTRIILTVLVSVLFFPVVARAEDFALRSDDRVVFFGDALVENSNWARCVESFVLVKYPQLRTRFFNCGMRSQTPADGLNRIESDLKPLAPTMVVVLYGPPDPVRDNAGEELLAEFRQNYEKLIQSIQSLNCRVVLITPPQPTAPKTPETPAEATSPWGAYAQVVRELGQTHQIPVVDWFSESETLHKKSPPAESPVVRGRLRPAQPSAIDQALVAARLLRFWNAEPILEEIEIDWSTGTCKTSLGNIQMKERTDSMLSVGLKSVPLPWNVPGVRTADLSILSEVHAEWCRFQLKMLHVPEPGVSLVWESRRIPLDRKQLSEGQSILDWPPIQFAPEVRNLLKYLSDKQGYHFKYWRQLRPRRPSEPELQEAYETHLKTLRQYEEGTTQILFRLPKTFDVELKFEVTNPEIKSKPVAPSDLTVPGEKANDGSSPAGDDSTEKE